LNSIETFIAVNRFGLGANTNQIASVEPSPRAWFERQINKDQAVPAALSGFAGSAEILKSIHTARLSGSKALRKETRKRYQRTFIDETLARARHMVRTETPFAERMVLFWSNHFTVSRTKAVIGHAITAYEREAIRPHLFGRFEDMLLAVVGHPVMLSYLDNNVSVGPRSQAGRRRGRSLNENLAREVLELHTLGVNGGYTQSDVTELAKALTGWTHGGMVGKRQRHKVHGNFAFRGFMHEPGSKTVMGKTYRQNGVYEAKAILRDLAGHPSTARFIATKLVRHFVADDPPAVAVRAVANTFRRTGGDLAAVSRSLYKLGALWRDPLPKVKTPYELVISTYRALGISDLKARHLRLPLKSMGQEPFSAPSPQGWPEQASHWIAPEALMRRIEWARAVAAKAAIDSTPTQLLDTLLGPVATRETTRMVGLAPSVDAGVALILASAEFQRR